MALFRPGKEKESAAIVVVGAAGLIALTVSLAMQSQLTVAGILEKLSVAAIVTFAVRWLMLQFEEGRPVVDLYRSSLEDLLHALGNARARVWICQTWFPLGGGGADRFTRVQAPEKRILLASFKLDSFIFARIATRWVDVPTVETAKQNVAASASAFKAQGLADCVRFYAVHHPGWIVVVDSTVFWGATPVDRDNWSDDLLFHKASLEDKAAQFWLKQFEFLWSAEHPRTGSRCSHGYEEERSFNGFLG